MQGGREKLFHMLNVLSIYCNRQQCRTHHHCCAYPECLQLASAWCKIAAVLASSGAAAANANAHTLSISGGIFAQYCHKLRCGLKLKLAYRLKLELVYWLGLEPLS